MTAITRLAEVRRTRPYYGEPSAVPGGITFRDLARIDPTLLELEHAVRRCWYRKREDFCANAAWYGAQAGYIGHEGIKQRLLRLVGWLRLEPHAILSTHDAYNVAYQYLYRALPDCGPGCYCSTGRPAPRSALPAAEAARRDWDRMRPIVEPFIRDRDGYRCLECGASGDADNPLTTDHIIPISLLGPNTPENLRTLCRRCNSAKGAR